MNKKIHQEFAFQSRELGAQIEDTLGEPPDLKRYAAVITSLITEYAKGTEIDDVNLLSFALFSYLSFDDPVGLLAQCKQYDKGDAQKAIAMVSCADADAAKALAAIAAKNPELARKAILTAFLFKNTKRWMPAEDTDEMEQEEERDDLHADDEKIKESDDNVESGGEGQDVMGLFDVREDKNGR